MSEAIVVIGGGQAGGRAVATLRQGGFDGAIVLAGEENHFPYERPPLSKAYLTTEGSKPSQVNPAEFYQAQAIDVRLACPVHRIDTGGKAVITSDGLRIPYGKLVIATGSRPRRLLNLETGSVPVAYLRVVEDAQLLSPRLVAGARIVIVGGGVIGMEVAASAVARGCRVTVVEAEGVLLSRCFSQFIGALLEKIHSDNGVKIIKGRKIKDTGRDEDGGFAILDNGDRVSADLLVVGVGIVPNVELADAAGLVVDDGIIVDAYGRTSDPDVYAVGDVTRQFQYYLGRKARIESWANANSQAENAATHILGHAAARNVIPWFWSDQYGLNVQVAGRIDGDGTALRGDVAAGRFCLFHLRESAVVGVTTVNAGRDMVAARRLIERRARIDRNVLEDAGIDLRRLAAEATPCLQPVNEVG